jgi:outer membrane protein TolC
MQAQGSERLTPSFSMRLLSVLGLTPSSSAAPSRPLILPLVNSITFRICWAIASLSLSGWKLSCSIVAQRWRIEMMTKEIKAAKAEFYPNINLTAFVGFDSVGIENFVRGGSGVIGGGPAVTLPIFDGGRLRNNLAFRNAEYDEIVERYNSIIVDAIRKVVDQVVSWRGAEAQRKEQQEALARFEEANRLAVICFREGLTTYLTATNNGILSMVDGRVMIQYIFPSVSEEASISSVRTDEPVKEALMNVADQLCQNI